MTDCSFGFHRRNEAWYWTVPETRANTSDQALVDEFMIGDYADDGSTSSEFSIVFQNLGVKSPCTPKIGMFNDSWHLMFEQPIQTLFTRLAELGDISPDDLKTLLLELGFADLTSRDKPGHLRS